MIGVGAYFIKGGFTYHIDFAGGAELRLAFEKPIKIGDLRRVISEKGWKDSVIQSIGVSEKEFIVRIGGEAEELEGKFKAEVGGEFESNKMTIENIDWVGAAVGKDTQWNAFVAILLSMLILLLYIAIRSKYSFAVGAVVALAHDLLAVLVCLLLVNEAISLNVLAAILTILGYSLNDTIVIFSRIRENLVKMKGASAVQTINTSINQTLKRTLLTSFSTLLALFTFYFFGGEALRSFSFVMILGVIFGTYSSIYIASPIALAIGSSVKGGE